MGYFIILDQALRLYLIPVTVVSNCDCCWFFKMTSINNKVFYPSVGQLMGEKGQDNQANEKLQSFLQTNGKVEDIVRKDLILPYGKVSGRLGKVVSRIIMILWDQHRIVSD